MDYRSNIDYKHVVHHGYGFQIDWDRMKEGISQIEEAMVKRMARLEEVKEAPDSIGYFTLHQHPPFLFGGETWISRRGLQSLGV